MSTPRSVTCVIVNETKGNLVATLAGGELNTKMEQGVLDGAMPCPIGADMSERFTCRRSEGSSVGPEGWACYDLENKGVVFRILWGDPTQGAGAFKVFHNHYEKHGDSWDEITFKDGDTPVDAAKIGEVADLTVEFKLSYKDSVPVPVGDFAYMIVKKDVAVSPDGAAKVDIPAYIPRWDDKRMTTKRKMVLAAMQKNLPLLWLSVDDNAPEAPAELGGGKFMLQGKWPGPGTSCTAFNPRIGGLVSPLTKTKWAFDAHKFPPAGDDGPWIRWGQHPTIKMPSVGDIYLLYRDEIKIPQPVDPKLSEAAAATEDGKKKMKAYYNEKALANPHQRHCGIILQVPSKPGEPWVCGDGGQQYKTIQAAFLVARPWELKKPGPRQTSETENWKRVVQSKEHGFAQPVDFEMDCPYLGGGAESSGNMDGNRLIGWLNLDMIEFDKKLMEKDEPFNQADLEALGARINQVASLAKK